MRPMRYYMRLVKCYMHRTRCHKYIYIYICVWLSMTISYLKLETGSFNKMDELLRDTRTCIRARFASAADHVDSCGLDTRAFGLDTEGVLYLGALYVGFYI